MDEVTVNAIEIIVNLFYLIKLEAHDAERIQKHLRDCEEPLKQLLLAANHDALPIGDGPEMGR